MNTKAALDHRIPSFDIPCSHNAEDTTESAAGTQQQSPGSAEGQNLYSASGQTARDSGARQAAAKIDETAEERAPYHRSDHDWSPYCLHAASAYLGTYLEECRALNSSRMGSAAPSDHTMLIFPPVRLQATPGSSKGWENRGRNSSADKHGRGRAAAWTSCLSWPHMRALQSWGHRQRPRDCQKSCAAR